METKSCIKCKEVKPIDCFPYVKSRNSYRGECKECKKISNKKWAENNKDKYVESKIKYKEKNRLIINERETLSRYIKKNSFSILPDNLLLEKECNLCGKTLPIENFSFSNSQNGKRMAECKACNALRNKEWKERNRGKIAGYRERTSDEKKVKDAEYRKKNREIIKVKSSEYSRKRWQRNVVFDSDLSQSIKLYEDCREKEGLAEVRCTYCGKWYLPRIIDVTSRLAAINRPNTPGIENRLYCSKECKMSCPVYRRSRYSAEQKKGNNGSREVQSELRKIVFERDSYTCQKCGLGVEATLHCHHVDPVANNPIESADIDNCITLCKACHKMAHKLPGCGTNELKCS